MSGFLQIFAVLERKLYRDTSQMELLRELLGLQEEMFILLVSMLEGEERVNIWRGKGVNIQRGKG